MGQEIEGSTTKNSPGNPFRVTDFSDASDHSTAGLCLPKENRGTIFFWGLEAGSQGAAAYYLVDATRCGIDLQNSTEAKAPFRYGLETESISRLIAKIRSSLSLNITELSEIMHVERPTIYAWQDQRAIPTPHNFRRLQLISRLADKWNEFSKAPLGTLVRVPASDGVSLVELLSGRAINEIEISLRMRELALVVKRINPPNAVDAFFERKALDPDRYRTKRNNIDRLTGKRTSRDSTG